MTKTRTKTSNPHHLKLKFFLVSPSLVNGLSFFCDQANRLKDPPEWVMWLDQLRKDAEALIDQISEERKRLKEDGAKKRTIDKVVVQLRSNAMPNISIRNKLKKALGKFKTDTTLEFNPKSGSLRRTDNFDQATDEELTTLIFCAAVDKRDWQYLRRCNDPNCAKYFCDEPGRRAQLFCCDKHGQQYRSRKPEGIKK